MARKKIVLQTNGPTLRTGLAENGRYLMKHLLKTGKYDLVYFCTNHVMSNDPNLGRMPCKAYGAIPADQNILNQLNANPLEARNVAYGSFFIDQIIRDEKPDIWWESDDIWSTPGYTNKPWFNQIHTIFHKTPDSLPVLDEAFNQARATPNYFTWAEFAAKEMRKRDPKCAHVRHIYGMFDTEHFAPIDPKAKLELRRRFGIDPKAVIFHMTNRNQYRKSMPQIIEAFAVFKRENPNANVKLHFHTSFSEKASGWDLPRLAQYHGVRQEDLLCTYVCKNCGQWHIAPYQGEDVNCPYCGAQKSMVTASTQFGVPDEEMKLMHGVSDAGLSIFNSGGLERFSVASLLCGLPTAITNYSCGEDFGNLPFVYPVSWEPYGQEGTNFIKAASNIESIKGFMAKVYKMQTKEREKIAEEGRDWAVKTFSCETIGKQWEDVFDALPPKDWSSITLRPKSKNDKFPFPQIGDASQFIKTLYNEILLVEPDPDGFKNWMTSLERGARREDIYAFFINEARKENAKNEPPKDFSVLFDQNSRKKILFVLKESGGDLFISTSLFKGLKDLYPDSDLYVGCDPKFNDVLAGNPYIHRILPFHPAMENELIMLNYVDHYYYPAIATQVRLNYLSHDKIGLDLHEKVS